MTTTWKSLPPSVWTTRDGHSQRFHAISVATGKSLCGIRARAFARPGAETREGDEPVLEPTCAVCVRLHSRKPT